MTGERVSEIERREAARAWAQWFLGYASWADEILWAYNNPADAQARLKACKERSA